jgi:hypothetical protein
MQSLNHVLSWGGTGRFTFARLSSVVMLQERPHFYDRHIAMLPVNSDSIRDILSVFGKYYW